MQDNKTHNTRSVVRTGSTAHGKYQLCLPDFWDGVNQPADKSVLAHLLQLLHFPLEAVTPCCTENSALEWINMCMEILEKLQGHCVCPKSYYPVTFGQSHISLAALQIKHSQIVQILLTVQSRGTSFLSSIKKTKSTFFLKINSPFRATIFFKDSQIPKLQLYLFV